MAKLIYAAIASLDGYVEDEEGRFDWAAPDDEVHAFVNDLERPVGTYLYGRRMYETMVFWETVSTSGDQSAVTRTSRRSGERPKRLCTRGRSRRLRARRRGSSALPKRCRSPPLRHTRRTSIRAGTAAGPSSSGWAFAARQVARRARRLAR
jgi:hypothetical protein